MDVTSIIQAYLETEGFDGLYMPGECACKKDDLAPCGKMPGSCKPGHILENNNCRECTFHIGKKGSESHCHCE